MRVALVTHYMPPHTGGVEEVGELLARSYSDAGHDVTWLACATPAATGDERDGAIRRIRMPAWNVLERRFAMPFPLVGPSALASIGDAVAASDVVHIHDCLYTTSLAADRAAKRHLRPVLLTQHVAMVSFGGGVVDPVLSLAYRVIGAGVIRRARRVAFVSESVRDWFVGQIGDVRGAVVVPNAVDLTTFLVATAAQRDDARATFGLPRDAAVVLFAGRLVPKKNIRALVAALPASARLLVIGDGPDRDSLAALGDRATHVPRLTHARMPQAFAAADVFVLPSRGEGLPLSLVEALASGLRCIVSDDPAFASLGPCDGVMRPTFNELGATIARVLSEGDSVRTARETAARAWAEQRYGLATFRDRYLSLLAEVGGS